MDFAVLVDCLIHLLKVLHGSSRNVGNQFKYFFQVRAILVFFTPMFHLVAFGEVCTLLVVGLEHTHSRF